MTVKTSSSDADFQAALKTLIGTYQPIIEAELKRLGVTSAPDATKIEPGQVCEEEWSRAVRIFEPFMAEDAVHRVLPENFRAVLGKPEEWSWCRRYALCSLVFGWLVCRGPQTFQSWSYYLSLYWKCVREFAGAPVSSPPLAAEAADFETLVRALATAYKPYLLGQLASVEYPAAIPEDVLSGATLCGAGQEEICGIFERLLNQDTARALFGAAAFESLSTAEYFSICGCWSRCALCLGCCLARVRGGDELRACLEDYVRCLEACIRPLNCELTAPTACETESAYPSVGIFRGVEILGTAAGADCAYYTLQWRQSGIGPWQSAGIVYPGGATQGACGVVSGLLGYLSTFPLVAPGLVEIELTVYASSPGETPCTATIDFQLARNLVWIQGIEGIDAATPPGVFDPTAQLTDGTGTVRSFGTAFEIIGSAVVGGCEGQSIKNYTLSFQAGFTTTTGGAWTQFWQVNYNTPYQIADGAQNPVFDQVLTSSWAQDDWVFLGGFPPHQQCTIIDNHLADENWDSQNLGGPYPVQFPNLACNEAPSSTWNSTPLPQPNCQSGRFTLRLTVQDTANNVTDNLRQVWIDNKSIHASIDQIGNVPDCAVINLSSFAAGSGDCSVPWPAPLWGVAYDEYIEEGNTSVPSDNFGGYSLSIMKAGGSLHSVLIPGPGNPPWSGPTTGTSRVGFPDPASLCQNPVPSVTPVPPLTNGILTSLDLRRFDAFCNTNPADADLVLQRATMTAGGQILTQGECCDYVIYLTVWDTSICPSTGTGNHTASAALPFRICNDLPAIVVP